MTMIMPQTTNMTLRRVFPGATPGAKLQEISIRGDGNCGDNALGLGTLLRIIDGGLVLTEEQFAEIWKHILGSIGLLALRGEDYCLSNFMSFIKQHSKQPPTFEEFKGFAKTDAALRAGLYGLHLGLAPALRNLECDLYGKNVRGVKLSTENRLYYAARAKDKTWISEEEIFRTATHIGLQANVYRVDANGNLIKYGTNEEDVKKNNVGEVPVVNLVNVGAHWNLLEDPNSDLIKDLKTKQIIPDATARQPTPKDQAELKKEQENAVWVQEKVNDASKLLDNWSATEVDAKVFDQAFDMFVAAIITNDESAFAAAKANVEKQLNIQQTVPQMKM